MNPGDIVLMVAVFALAISAHESSHAYVAEVNGDPTGRRQGRISLNPLNHVDPIGTIVFPLFLIMMGAPVFGWARPVPVNPANLRHPRRDRALVSLAGPAANMGLASISLVLTVVLAPLIVTASYGDGLGKLLLYNTLINTLLAVFNLIPVPPLDGSGILQYFLSARWERWMRENQFMLSIVLLLLFVSGGLSLFLRPVLQIVWTTQSVLVQIFWGAGVARDLLSLAFG